MRLHRSLTGFSRSLALLAFVLALTLRFAIPTGYMLAGDGSLAIVPCPSAGAVPQAPPLAHDMAGMMAAMPMTHMGHAMSHAEPAHHDPAKHQDTSCPYAALSAPALPPDPPVLALKDLPAFAELHVSFVQQLALPALAAPPPPSRGPPLLA